LGVHDGRGGIGAASMVVAGEAGEVVVEFGEDPFLAPGGEVAVDRLMWREVVRQIAPGDSGAVEVEDRVEDLSQVVGGRAALDADLGAGVGTGLAPGDQPGCDQLPAGVGQVGGISTAIGHDTGICCGNTAAPDAGSAYFVAKANQTRSRADIWGKRAKVNGMKSG
jgi:hypothetical protein